MSEQKSQFVDRLKRFNSQERKPSMIRYIDVEGGTLFDVNYSAIELKLAAGIKAGEITVEDIYKGIPIKCFRTACNNDADPKCIHRDLRQAYCRKCAIKINRENGEVLIPIPENQES